MQKIVQKNILFLVRNKINLLLNLIEELQKLIKYKIYLIIKVNEFFYIKNGWFQKEIIPVTIPGIKGEKDIVISEDEEYKKLKIDKVSVLKPAFIPNGTVTAANSSKLNDGASALILMSSQKAKKLGLKPIAKVLGIK